MTDTYQLQIFPAIDIRGGKVVRLSEGDYDRMTVYADDPTEILSTFRQTGAHNLHLVDLDGAKDGSPVNFDIIRRLAADGTMFTEVGGGIRDEKRIYDYLSSGVDRVILGTVAVRNFPFVEKMVKKYGDAIAVGVDANGGFVAVSGWLEVTSLPSVEFCRRLSEAGVSTVIYTDISCDGMLQGTNLAVYGQLKEISALNIVASGGISFYEEIEALKKMRTYGAIVGKALYTGKLSLDRVLRIAADAE